MDVWDGCEGCEGRYHGGLYRWGAYRGATAGQGRKVSSVGPRGVGYAHGRVQRCGGSLSSPPTEFLGESHSLLRVGDGLVGARHDGDAARDGGAPRGGLVAHGVDCLGQRPHEGDAGLGTFARKRRVLRQEPVATGGGSSGLRVQKPGRAAVLPPQSTMHRMDFLSPWSGWPNTHIII